MNKELTAIINDCINSKNIDLGKKLAPSKKLINSKTLHWDDKLDVYRIDFTNPDVNTILIAIAEKRLDRKPESDVISILKFVNDFEEEIKKPQSNISWPGLIELKNSLKIHLLIRLINEQHIDILAFLDELTKKESKRPNELYAFEDLFFRTLPFLKIDVEIILDFIKNKYSKNHYEHAINNFCRNLGFTNQTMANDLFELGKKNGLHQLGVLSANLLVGLYNNGDNFAYEKAKILFLDNEMLSIFFFGRVQLKTIQEINAAIEIVEKVHKTNEQALFELEYFYANLLRNEEVTNDIIDYCFEKFKELFIIENDNLRWRIIHTFSHSIDDFEGERYNFLHFALNTGKNFNYVKSYFNTFKNPVFFFDLFSYVFTNLGIRTNVDLFEDDFIHFWTTSNELTENLLLECLSGADKLLRTGAIKLILNSHYVCNIDLLKFKKEEEQLRVIEAFADFPHSIENLTSLMLVLRKSKFPKVVKYLQERLSILIFEAYHEYLFDLIEKNIGKTKQENEFIKPIRKALEYYKKIKELKNSVNDLNPLENERQLMDLYYRLEHENQAIMMNEIKTGKGSFLEHFGKTQIIVRGNAWKTDNDDVIRPLAKIEHSAVLDGRAYKNPDQFEHILNNPKSEF